MMKWTMLIVLAIGIHNFAQADENLTVKIFTPANIKSLLGKFPAPGSKEELEDFETLLDWQKNRTKEECLLAAKQDHANLVNLFAIENGPLSLQEAKYNEKILALKIANIGVNIMIAKKQYNRPRPYLANKEIHPCINLESSTAYPSGHTTLSYAIAGFLAERFPERKEAIYKRAEQNSLNRVIGGVHHPSDIEAGKKLGNALYQAMKSDD